MKETWRVYVRNPEGVWKVVAVGLERQEADLIAAQYRPLLVTIEKDERVEKDEE